MRRPMSTPPTMRAMRNRHGEIDTRARDAQADRFADATTPVAPNHRHRRTRRHLSGGRWPVRRDIPRMLTRRRPVVWTLVPRPTPGL